MGQKKNKKNRDKTSNPNPQSISESGQTNAGNNSGNKNGGLNFEPDKKWTRNEKINLFLAIGTFALFGISVLQYRSSKISTDAVIKSAEAAVKSDSIIAKQFEIDNTPYLVLKSYEVKSFAPNTRFSIAYQLVNIGKHPAQMVSTASSIQCAPQLPQDSVILASSANAAEVGVARDFTYKANSIMINDIPYFTIATSLNPINKQQYDSVVKGSHKIYWSGAFIYKNLIDHRKRKFSFVFEFSSDLPVVCRYQSQKYIP